MLAAPRAYAASRPVAFVCTRAPGLLLTAAIAAAAEALSKHTAGLSPLLWASLGGIAVGTSLRAFSGRAGGSTFDASSRAAADAQRAVEPGVLFAKQRLLRLGIILYGAKLTVAKIMGIGAAGLLADLYSVGSTLGLGLALGHWLRMDAKLTVLIATGSAICGCSAVAATQPIVAAEPHQVAAAVGTVVLCGTAAMFIYPWLYGAVPWLAADPRLMGLYTGSTVHELAGVVAASNAMGADVASVAVVTKLVRVCMLEPWLLLLFYNQHRLGIGPGSSSSSSGGGGGGKLDEKLEAGVAGEASPSAVPGGRGVPWFALGFAGVAALNSAVGFGPAATAACGALSSACLAAAMAALGLDADVAKVKALGPKPLLLAAALWGNLLAGGGLVARFLDAWL
jgi:uncharacterized integral membrane protein (TIGR00698 family)